MLSEYFHASETMSNFLVATPKNVEMHATRKKSVAGKRLKNIVGIWIPHRGFRMKIRLKKAKDLNNFAFKPTINSTPQ